MAENTPVGGGAESQPGALEGGGTDAVRGNGLGGRLGGGGGGEVGGVGGVGGVVRRIREGRGWTVRKLAGEVGCSASYISQIESGQKTPEDGLLARVERALGMERGALVGVARWERTPGDVKLELSRLAGERDRMLEALRSVLSDTSLRGSAQIEALRVRTGMSDEDKDAALELGEAMRAGDGTNGERVRGREGEGSARGVDERGRLGQAFRLVALPQEVPLINKVAAGYPTEFTDLGYPARVADEYIRCPDLCDADAFAARVVGDSMFPEYREGDVVVFSPAKPVKDGMDCFVRLEPDGETTFKRVYFERRADADGEGAERIRLQPLNAKYAPRVVEREMVSGLYAAVSVIKKIG